MSDLPIGSLRITDPHQKLGARQRKAKHQNVTGGGAKKDAGTLAGYRHQSEKRRTQKGEETPLPKL